MMFARIWSLSSELVCSVVDRRARWAGWMLSMVLLTCFNAWWEKMSRDAPMRRKESSPSASWVESRVALVSSP